MVQLVTFKETPISEMYAALERNKNNPGVMVRSFLELTDAVTDGEVAFVDATNPSILLAEMFSVGLHGGLMENAATLRNMYSSRSEQTSELVDHMSDWDFANMFASPSTEPFRFFINLKAFVAAAVRDETEKCRKVVIPRDTEVHKNGRYFTLHYPIVLRYYDVGNLEISYDTSITSNFQVLETNIIPNYIVKTPDDSQFISFVVPMMQVKIVRITETVTKGQAFERTYPFTEQFYYARGWHRNSSTNNLWTEIRTTHGNLNYDQRFPTLLLTVEADQLKFRLPQVYMLNDRMLGEIAVDIYTTYGNMNERMPDDQYDVNFRNLDQAQNTIYTPQALSTIQRWASPEGILTGGKDGLTFEQKRSRVINNATGPQELPITPSQLIARVENSGFTINKTVDMVTERIFHATRKLPAPTNQKLITAANIGIHTFITEANILTNHEFVYDNGNRWTLSPRNLYEYNNGVIRLLSSHEVRGIQQLDISSKVVHLNKRSFLYTPFHYVLDNSNQEFDLRAYYLDKPKPDVIDFRRMNSSMQLTVNTQQREILRTETGYQLRTKVKSGGFFKQVPDTQIGVQLRFSPKGDESHVYIRGYQVGIDDGERVFAFDIKTDFDINSNDALHVLDVSVAGNDGQTAWIDLETVFDIFICSNNVGGNYVREDWIDEFGPWQFEEGFVPITHEKLKIKLGYALKNLWRRAANQKSNYPYKRYEFDILDYWENDKYEEDAHTGNTWSIDPTTNLPVRKLKYAKGDPKVDVITGEPIYKHKKGDVIFEFGVPMEESELRQPKEIDMLFIDGRHYFVTDPVYLDYNQELVDILVDWITEGLGDTMKRVLDKTKVYFYPRSQIGAVTVEYGDARIKTIPSEQSPRIDIYLGDNVFNDDDMRDTIRRTTLKLLDAALTGNTMNNSEISDLLRQTYGSTVKSFKLYGFGPDLDIYFATVTQLDRSLALKRVIEAQGDGGLIMKEDVTFNFYRAKVNSAI